MSAAAMNRSSGEIATAMNQSLNCSPREEPSTSASFPSRRRLDCAPRSIPPSRYGLCRTFSTPDTAARAANAPWRCSWPRLPPRLDPTTISGLRSSNAVCAVFSAPAKSSCGSAGFLTTVLRGRRHQVDFKFTSPMAPNTSRGLAREGNRQADSESRVRVS